MVNGRNTTSLNNSDLLACIISEDERYCEMQGSGKTIRTPSSQFASLSFASPLTKGGLSVSPVSTFVRGVGCPKLRAF